MSMSNDSENALLLYIFNSVAITTTLNFPDTTSVAVCLHTGDPGEAGTPVNSETSYTGYYRVVLARDDSSDWTVTNNSVSPAANIEFGECTAEPGAALTHWSVVTSGLPLDEGAILFSGAISPSIVMAVGVIPIIKTTSTITLD